MVIGIIAVLISILLPTLSSARRQAEAAKCLATLREIGNAYQMYAVENKGFYPPAQLMPASGMKYNVNGIDYPTSGYGAYWFNFLSKYVTKGKVGLESSNAQDASEARRAIFWGCPTWLGYQSTTLGGVNRLQVGYGMNGFPTHKSDYPKPPTNHPTTAKPDETSFIQNWGAAAQTGRFFRQTEWGRQGSERGLVADCLFWEYSAEHVDPATGMKGQALLTNSTGAGNAAFGLANTTVDAYRHGKYPGAQDSNVFKLTGGQVGFNILYADGHCARAIDRTEAFRALRQRYPN